MTTKELQKRNEKSQALKVLRANGDFFVESAEGMVLYKVTPMGRRIRLSFPAPAGTSPEGLRTTLISSASISFPS